MPPVRCWLRRFMTDQLTMLWRVKHHFPHNRILNSKPASNNLSDHNSSTSMFRQVLQTGRTLMRLQLFLAKKQGLPTCHPTVRSEEHTSELQSLMRISYAVFCLKKKTKQQTHN